MFATPRHRVVNLDLSDRTAALPTFERYRNPLPSIWRFQTSPILERLSTVLKRVGEDDTVALEHQR